MARAKVVLGSCYGDEGKGLVVDYLTSQEKNPNKVVVRFNGGAQAGHTVVTPEGVRHVFSHFSSGTMAGASTYLAKHFVCNPLMFWKEAKQLHGLGIPMPVVAVDPRCYITTPYDMLINQMKEDARGKSRHGSVGLGFGETIERNLYPAFQLWRSDLTDRDKLVGKMRLIRDQWMEIRCQQLNLRPIQKGDPAMTDATLERVVESAEAFDQATTIAGAEFLEKRAVIFEGAQGLALDMDGPNFPHVTRSNTGLTNVMPIAHGLNLSLDVVYVTRPYLTKHGAGPLPGECPPEPTMVDETNTAHPYQGALRFGKLVVADLKARIADDVKRAGGMGLILAQTSMALTCTDQVPPAKVSELMSKLGNVRYRSSGPRRDCVEAV
jgi:adenylosuccinate synthase